MRKTATNMGFCASGADGITISCVLSPASVSADEQRRAFECIFNL